MTEKEAREAACEKWVNAVPYSEMPCTCSVVTDAYHAGYRHALLESPAIKELLAELEYWNNTQWERDVLAAFERAREEMK